MEQIKVCLISSSEEKTEKIKTMLGKAGDIAVSLVEHYENLPVEKIVSSEPDIILLLPDNKNEDIAGMAKKLYVALPACAQILICEQTDFESLQQAVKAGIRNILKWPVKQEELFEDIRYLYNIETVRSNRKPVLSGSKRMAQVVTVFGTKGGIGKTTISVNLAVALSRLGKKVAIVDLDLQFGDVGVFLDMDVKDSISELVEENNFDPGKIKSYMQLHKSGLYALCAPKSPEYAEAVTPSHVEKIIESLRSCFDYVIIDTPPIFNDNTITALEHSNLILFILTLDISTLRNAKISMGILDSLQNMRKTRVIVNREVDSIISLKDMEKIVKLPVFCRIPSDWKTATMSLNKGAPFVTDMPKTKISAAINNLARLTAGLR